MSNIRHWPHLAQPYDLALEQAVAFLFARYEIQAIVASGSILRGNPDAGSDLDIVAIQRAPSRQRVQRRFNGVPAELFVNSVDWIIRTFETERRRGRPSLAHMLATGTAIHDPDRLAATLQAEAAVLLAAGPRLTPDEVRDWRYGGATWFEDAVDLVERDPALCRLALHHAVEEALCYRYLAANRWEPRFKELIAGLGELDPELPALVERFFAAQDIQSQLRTAEAIMVACIGETGFFEWESETEPS